jgi:hypothetical protein
MLPIVLILNVLGAVAVESLPVASQNRTDDDPLALALAVKSTLESLKTEKPIAFWVEVMEAIEAKADVLLEIYGRPIGELTDFIEIKIHTLATDYVIAAALNADLTELPEFADKLIQAVEAQNSEAIIENVISIKVTASRIVSAVSNLDDATITYEPNRGERPTGQAKRVRRQTINIYGGCIHIHLAHYG